MHFLTDPEIWASFLALAALEIVLGIDNVIFISLTAAKLPPAEARRARVIGLGLALVLRLALLASLTWLVGLTAPIITAFGYEASWRDIILIAGGLFLLTKGTLEIHATVEGDHAKPQAGASAAFAAIIAQIVVIDAVFSIDSVITAIGMTDEIFVMVAAVVVSIMLMLAASEPMSRFIEKRPTTKMLALSFLLLIGVALIADGLHFHIPRGYLYFAIAFSAGVEVLNVIAQARRRSARA